jgi:hypothetical protein
VEGLGIHSRRIQHDVRPRAITRSGRHKKGKGRGQREMIVGCYR